MNKLSLQLFNIQRVKSAVLRKFSVSAANNKSYECKLLVIGGGSGGCTIAAKFARKSETKRQVIILEPSQVHYYQALFTLVGAGVTSLGETARPMASVLPSRALWLRDAAAAVDPDSACVTTAGGDIINYQYLVIATGIKNDYHKIKGLQEAMDNQSSGVSTIYDPESAEVTFQNLRAFKGGDAIFTFPRGPVKCPGAPQKIAYLTDSYLTQKNIRFKSTITYNTHLPVIFGIKKYANELVKVAERKDIVVNYRTTLLSIDPDKREATFTLDDDGEGCTVTRPYNMLHVTPPQSPHEFISSNPALADQTGFLDVNLHTLQHTKYPNIFGIGDCTNTPNSKTAAAIAKQSYVVERNLLETMRDESPSAFYNGYGACPLVTSYNTCILAEFLYNGEVHETFPFDQSKERWISYQMKRRMFPFIYWNFMLHGWYHGPEFVRKIVNPFAK